MIMVSTKGVVTMQQALAVFKGDKFVRYLTINPGRDYEPAGPGETVRTIVFENPNGGEF